MIKLVLYDHIFVTYSQNSSSCILDQS